MFLNFYGFLYFYFLLLKFLRYVIIYHILFEVFNLLFSSISFILASISIFSKLRTYPLTPIPKCPPYSDHYKDPYIPNFIPWCSPNNLQLLQGLLFNDQQFIKKKNTNNKFVLINQTNQPLLLT